MAKQDLAAKRVFMAKHELAAKRVFTAEREAERAARRGLGRRGLGTERGLGMEAGLATERVWRVTLLGPSPRVHVTERRPRMHWAWRWVSKDRRGRGSSR